MVELDTTHAKEPADLWLPCPAVHGRHIICSASASLQRAHHFERTPSTSAGGICHHKPCFLSRSSGVLAPRPPTRSPGDHWERRGFALPLKARQAGAQPQRRGSKQSFASIGREHMEPEKATTAFKRGDCLCGGTWGRHGCERCPSKYLRCPQPNSQPRPSITSTLQTRLGLSPTYQRTYSGCLLRGMRNDPDNPLRT